ncbi:hypothetical protein N7G274_007640 [Stereocaulon virgatum]|uniref:Uncharacterized protein n=1 Tax=Stereocaulon virgatum TaxID=373712 RepID=A0ABR4A494_9LECA
MTHPGILLVDHHVQSTHNKDVEGFLALVPPVLIIAREDSHYWETYQASLRLRLQLSAISPATPPQPIDFRQALIILKGPIDILRQSVDCLDTIPTHACPLIPSLDPISLK